MPNTDDFAMIRASRPEPGPLTAAERASIEEQLMTTMNKPGPTAIEPPRAHRDDRLVVARGDLPHGAPHGGTRRAGGAAFDGVTAAAAGHRRGRARHGSKLGAMVGVAATVVLVVAALGIAARRPAGPPEPPGPPGPPAAAVQLRLVADRSEIATVNPAPPYSVMTRITTGGDPTTTADETVYRLGGGDTISTGPPCTPRAYCAVPIDAYPAITDIPVTGSATEVRAGVEHHVDTVLAQTAPNGPSRAELTLMTVELALRDPALGPAGRAELLRLVADLGSVTVQPNVTTALGRAGTQFRVAVGAGALALVVDPADDQLLEVRTGTASTPFVQSWAAPVAPPTLPAPVAQLAADLAAHHATLEAASSSPSCVIGVGAPGTPNYGFTVPDGLAFAHCW